jgi:hypothetical protein
LGERLLAERRRTGPFISEAAKVAGVDETTFWWWRAAVASRAIRGPRRAAQFLGDL